MIETSTDGVPPAEDAQDAQDARMSLSGSLTIHDAETIRAALAARLAGCRCLVLETDELDAVDVAGIQLLIALRRNAERAGKVVRLAPPPDGALLTALIAAGFRTTGDHNAPAMGRDEFWWGRS